MILRIILLFLGITFIGFGYAIRISKKYHLINDFDNNKKAKRLDDYYAKRVGMIELIGGLICVMLAIVAMFFNDIFILYVFALCVVGLIVALTVNYVKSINHKK